MKYAAVIAAVVLLAGSLQLTRAGYSVDEEFTVFAVRGIEAHGLPLLPSGLLYDRGAAYSYASWLAHAVTGAELPAYRAIGLLCAALSVLLTHVFVRRLSNGSAAILASALVTTSIPFWATATSGRFYAPFLAAWLVLMILFTHRSMWIALVVAAALARLTHELAFLAAAVPATFVLLAAGYRRHWIKVTIAVVAGLVAGQAVLFAMHAAAPSSGETMVRRFFLWQVLNLFEVPGDRQFGIPLVVMVIGWIATPKRAGTISVIALSIATAIFAFSIAQATNSAPLSAGLIRSTVSDGLRYPLDMFWHIARATPLTLTIALACLVARAAGLGGDWRRPQRSLHLLWVGWVLWFGVIESGITTNYLLLPITLMLMAIAVDLHALMADPAAPIRRYSSSSAVPAWIGMTLIAIVVAFDQWRGPGSMAEKVELARPTIQADGVEDIRATLQPNDRIACTDELGCLMTIGRIDRWLALDEYVRERFLVRRGAGPVSGVYTGVPAAMRPAELFEGELPDRVLIVDIFKEYPIGNSRSWLPKAIEEDGLRVIPLLETPQLRILQVSPPEAIALSAQLRQDAIVSGARPRMRQVP